MEGERVVFTEEGSEAIARANGGGCAPYPLADPSEAEADSAIRHHRLPASRHTYAGLVRGPASFYHLVGAGEERLRHSEAERLRGLHIHDELIFCRCLHLEEPRWR